MPRKKIAVEFKRFAQAVWRALTGILFNFTVALTSG